MNKRWWWWFMHTYIYTYMHYITLMYVITYIALQDIPLHYITLHYITLYCIALHYITLYYRQKTHTAIRVCVLNWMYVCMCSFWWCEALRTIGCLDFRSKTHANRLWSVMSSSSRVLCRNSACMILMSSDVLEMRNEPRGLHEWQFSLDAAWFSRAMLAYAL